MGEKKFGEPWSNEEWQDSCSFSIVDKDAREVEPSVSEQFNPIRDRICACVNACAGMENPEKEIAAKDAEIARLKSESTEMLNIAVEIATEKLRSDNAALRSVLKKHEWAQVGTRHRADFICVDCGWNKAHCHARGCEIDRLLKGEKP